MLLVIHILNGPTVVIYNSLTFSTLATVGSYYECPSGRVHSGKGWAVPENLILTV